ncbi:protein FAM212B-like [Scleropages formosus]|nr:protein FAM212B-like [Scleropages formosus]
MRKAGNGLHAQMNSMMGALQELKLLRLQTTLERLEISGKPSHTCSPNHHVFFSPPTFFSPAPPVELCPPSPWTLDRELKASPRSSLAKISSASCCQGGTPPPSGRYPGESGYSQECNRSSFPVRQTLAPWGTHELSGVPGSLRNLGVDGQSLENDFSEESSNDSSDWTSTLMSRGRNRQPLILGDNIFADLVGNWLDLPDLEKKAPSLAGWDNDEEDKKEPECLLRLSHSQEICRRFSLTANIFKKLLRSVCPDKDKLLMEKPGWMPLDDPDAELLKRCKKGTKKGTFYLPFWSRKNGQQRKGRSDLCPTEGRTQTSVMCSTKGDQEVEENVQPKFDYSIAVWV